MPTSIDAVSESQSSGKALPALAHEVRERIRTVPPARAALVGMSGIDGSGKSHLSAGLASELRLLGLRVALIGIDVWQNPQTIRFGGADPGVHFYEHCIRFPELFQQLLHPLVACRSIHFEMLAIRTDADAWEPLTYDFTDVDVVLVEGILLFKRVLAPEFDVRIWVECSFEAGLRRALRRNVEQLPESRLLEDYDRIYHAAQRYHFKLDAPRSAAHLMVDNESDAAPALARGSKA